MNNLIAAGIILNVCLIVGVSQLLAEQAMVDSLYKKDIPHLIVKGIGLITVDEYLESEVANSVMDDIELSSSYYIEVCCVSIDLLLLPVRRVKIDEAMMGVLMSLKGKVSDYVVRRDISGPDFFVVLDVNEIPVYGFEYWNDETDAPFFNLFRVKVGESGYIIDGYIFPEINSGLNEQQMKYIAAFRRSLISPELYASLRDNFSSMIGTIYP